MCDIALLASSGYLNVINHLPFFREESIYVTGPYCSKISVKCSLRTLGVAPSRTTFADLSEFPYPRDASRERDNDLDLDLDRFLALDLDFDLDLDLDLETDLERFIETSELDLPRDSTG